MNRSQPDTGRERLQELDGWRAISVLLVILHHFFAYQHPHSIARYPYLASIADYCGLLGVYTFFVISGFVICRLLIIEEQRYGSVSLKAFYCRRLFRIVPPFYFYLAVICLLTGLGLITQKWQSIQFAALFLHDGYHSDTGIIWFAGHTWTLAMEEQFYLIFPTIWILTSRRWKGRVFLGILSVLIIWNLVANQGRFGGINIPVVRQGFVCICCGVLIAIYEFRARLLAKAVPAFVIPAVALILFLYPANADDLKATAYKCLFLPPAIGLLLMFSLERGPWLRAFLRWAPIQAIGITSYGIYLWQELFTAPKMFYTGRGMVISLLLPLLCVVVPLSYFLVEKPAMRYGRTLAARIRERSIPTATVA